MLVSHLLPLGLPLLPPRQTFIALIETTWRSPFALFAYACLLPHKRACSLIIVQDLILDSSLGTSLILLLPLAGRIVL